MSALEERVEAMESQLREVRVRLGMEIPDTSHLTAEQIATQKRAGILPIGVGAASKSTLPGQVVEYAPGFSRTREAVANLRAEPMTPAEALEHYGGNSVRVFFTEPIKVIDADDLRAIQYPKGWNSVCKKHLPQLRGRAEWDAEAKSTNLEDSRPTPNADTPPST